MDSGGRYDLCIGPEFHFNGYYSPEKMKDLEHQVKEKIQLVFSNVQETWKIQQCGISMIDTEYEESPLIIIPHLLLIIQEAKKLGMKVENYSNCFIDDNGTGVLTIRNHEGKIQVNVFVGFGLVPEKGKVGDLYMYDVDSVVSGWSNVKPKPLII